MGDLTTKTNVKAYLGLTGIEDDALIDSLITMSSEFVESFCGRKFGEASYTEYQDGDGINKVLFLRQWPVISFTSLYDDPNRAYGSDTLIAIADYVVDNTKGTITLDGLKFGNGIANIKAVYTAGYKLPGATGGSGADLPKDLEHACIELVAIRKSDRGRERLGKSSQSMGDGGTDSYIQDIPWQIKSVLNLYRRRRV